MALPIGKARRWRLGWWRSPRLGILVPGAHAEGKKLALLIGVDKYPEGSGFTSLPYAERRRRAVGRGPARLGLSARARPRTDLETRQPESSLHSLAPERPPRGQTAGRGSQAGGQFDRRAVGPRDHPQGRGKRAVKETRSSAPIDVDLAEPESLLPLDELYTTLEKSEARTKVLFVDACRNDPTEGRAAAIPFASEPPPASIAALFACSDGEVAWDASDLGGGHGVFFHYVIEGLKGDADASAGNRDGKVSLAELLAYTQDKVPDYVSFRRGRRQMPILLGNTGRITLLDLSGFRPADIITSKFTGMRLNLIPAG